MTVIGGMFSVFTGALLSHFFEKVNLLKFLEQHLRNKKEKALFQKALIDADLTVKGHFNQNILVSIQYPEKLDLNWVVECLNIENIADEKFNKALGWPDIIVDSTSELYRNDIQEVAQFFVQTLLTLLARKDHEFRNLITWSNTNILNHKLDSISSDFNKRLNSLAADVNKIAESDKELLSFFLPAETSLRLNTQHSNLQESTFFRKSGPIACDFDDKKVFRRDEDLKQLKEILNSHRGIIIKGAQATGKSVLVRQLSYDEILDGTSVYFFDVRGYWTQSIEWDRLINEVHHLKEKDQNVLLIIEDIHLQIQGINRLLASMDDTWPKIVCTMRPIDLEYSLHRRENYLNRLKYHSLSSDVVYNIIKLFCDNKKLNFNDDLVKHIVRMTADNLWLLSYTLLSYEKIDTRLPKLKDINKEVGKDLFDIQYFNGDDPIYPRILIILSVLSQYEVATDQSFVEETFGKDAIISLRRLTIQGEIESYFIRNRHYYRIPHSKLAKVYLTFSKNSEWEHSVYENEKKFRINYFRFFRFKRTFY